jgi:hypothetical protein
MPSFGGEVKPSVPCHSFATCKKSLTISVEVMIIRLNLFGHFSRIIPPFTNRGGAPLEMTGETKSSAQRACRLRPRCNGAIGPWIHVPIYLSSWARPPDLKFFGILLWGSQKVQLTVQLNMLTVLNYKDSIMAANEIVTLHCLLFWLLNHAFCPMSRNNQQMDQFLSSYYFT